MDSRESADTRSERTAQEQTVFGSNQPLWTAEENARILGLLDQEEVPERTLLRLFPGRSLSSIKSKLTRERGKVSSPRTGNVAILKQSEHGITDTWQARHKKDAAKGSRMLRDAILRVYFNQAPA